MDLDKLYQTDIDALQAFIDYADSVDLDELSPETQLFFTATKETARKAIDLLIENRKELILQSQVAAEKVDHG